MHGHVGLQDGCVYVVRVAHKACTVSSGSRRITRRVSFRTPGTQVAIEDPCSGPAFKNRAPGIGRFGIPVITKGQGVETVAML